MPGLLNPFAYGSGTPPATLLSTMLTDSPWGVWMENEASGSTLADSSGNSRPMTIAGSPTGYQFTGTGASVQGIQWPASSTIGATCGTNTTTAATSYTLTAWVYLTANPVSSSLSVFAVDNATAGSRLLVNVLGTVSLTVQNSGSTSASTTGSVVLNSWNFIAGVNAANTLHVRLNGVNSSTATKAAAMSGRTPKIHLSAGATVQAGTIGPCAYFETALSDARLDAHYAAGL